MQGGKVPESRFDAENRRFADSPELGIVPLGTHSIFVQLLSQSLYGKTTERPIPMAAGQ